MAKLPTCPFCGESILKGSPTKLYKNKHYHNNCYKKMQEEIYNNYKNGNTNYSSASPFNETKKSVTEEEVYEKICKLFGINEFTALISTQFKTLCSMKNITYQGIIEALEYYYNIQGNLPKLEYGIGMISRIYWDAQSFYTKKQILTEKNSLFRTKNITNTVRVLCKSNKKSNKNLIDINKL